MIERRYPSQQYISSENVLAKDEGCDDVKGIISDFPFHIKVTMYICTRIIGHARHYPKTRKGKVSPVLCEKYMRDRKQEKKKHKDSLYLHIKQTHLSPKWASGAETRAFTIFTRAQPAISPRPERCVGVRVDIPLLFLIFAFSNVEVPIRSAVPPLLDCTTNIPAQCTADTLEPFPCARHYCGERVLTRFYCDIVALAKLDTTFAIERTVCSRSRSAGDSNA